MSAAKGKAFRFGCQDVLEGELRECLVQNFGLLMYMHLSRTYRLGVKVSFCITNKVMQRGLGSGSLRDVDLPPEDTKYIEL